MQLLPDTGGHLGPPGMGKKGTENDSSPNHSLISQAAKDGDRLVLSGSKFGNHVYAQWEQSLIRNQTISDSQSSRKGDHPCQGGTSMPNETRNEVLPETECSSSNVYE
jgi:hypothetical protein